MTPSAPPSSPAEASSDRLDSWKEIATYLNRGVTTVQRWEREEGLPVHRQQHDVQGSVYAFKQELEAWRDKRTVRVDGNDNAQFEDAPRDRPSRWLRPLLAAVSLIVAIGIGAIAARVILVENTKSVRRLTVVVPDEAPMVINGTDRNLAITPDGTRVIYVGGTGASRLFVRALDRVDAIPITSPGSPRHPFSSPDGRWVGFFDDGILKKVPISGGPATTLTSSRRPGAGPTTDSSDEFTIEASSARGASWGPMNQIAFSMRGRLWRVSADGGDPQILAEPDTAKAEAAYCWPEYTPDGRALVFTIVPSGEWSDTSGAAKSSQLAILDFSTGQRKSIIEGGSAGRYLDGGQLVYAAAASIRTVAFDLPHLTVIGMPRTAVSGVATSVRGSADFDVARDGTLVYATGSAESDLVTVTWVDRHGREDPLGIAPSMYRYPRLSPDGRRLALASPRDLGLWDFARRTLSWFGIGPTSYPVWTPNGKRIIFASTRTGEPQMYWQPLDGSDNVSLLLKSPRQQFPYAVSPDGRSLLFRENADSPDLMLLDLAGEHRSRGVLRSRFRELNGDFSPDGKLLVYQSNENGQDEIYVRSFPNVSASSWQISSGGGSRPMWALNGREIYYVSPAGVVMSVAVDPQGSGIVTGAPTQVFDGPYYFGGGPIEGRTFDVSPIDGRFLMLKYAGASKPVSSTRNIQVVLNWFEELKLSARVD